MAGQQVRFAGGAPDQHLPAGLRHKMSLAASQAAAQHRCMDDNPFCRPEKICEKCQPEPVSRGTGSIEDQFLAMLGDTVAASSTHTSDTNGRASPPRRLLKDRLAQSLTLRERQAEASAAKEAHDAPPIRSPKLTRGRKETANKAAAVPAGESRGMRKQRLAQSLSLRGAQATTAAAPKEAQDAPATESKRILKVRLTQSLTLRGTPEIAVGAKFWSSRGTKYRN